jgi:hypothetical protein
LRFKEAEWLWLNSLSQGERYLLEEGHPEEYDPAAYTHYGEFFLTICGIKPCFLVTNTHYPMFGELLYRNVLKYLLPELPGFEFFRVEHPCVSSPPSPITRPTQGGVGNSSPQYKQSLSSRDQHSQSPTTVVASGSYSPVIEGHERSLSPMPMMMPQQRPSKIIYIFTSRYHPKFPLIQELLMKPQKCPAPAELLGKALGYPVPCGQSTFSYIDQTTSEELGIDGGVVVFEFTARAGFERSIKMHFERCAAEFRKLGKVLTISRQ